jgi:putative acetyltransferase
VKNSALQTPSQAEKEIRWTQATDVDGIVTLYKAVGHAGGGLARTPDEVTRDYVNDFLHAALNGGVALVATDDAGNVIGEIHTRPLGPRAFAHVLGDLTIAIHPSWQGRGVGRRIFSHLLEVVETGMPHVLRVELKSGESNARAIGMYESLGFRKEGRMDNRIRLADGSLDADIPMAWHRATQA